MKGKFTKADDMLENEFFGRKKKLAIYKKYSGKQTLENFLTRVGKFLKKF